MAAKLIRGRGTASRITNRFESRAYEPEIVEADGEEVPPRPGTIYIEDQSKSILSRNDSPDVNFDVGINPYRGCEHGCVYCYARPMHEYLGFSAGLDFETRIMVKKSAPELLRKALAARSWVPQAIGLSGATDVYQPIERKLEITRSCLEVLADFRNPTIIITKNRLVMRDIDVLSKLASFGGVRVMVSLTTLDLELNRVMEPRTSSPSQRLDAIRQLSDAGIPVGTLVAPVVPGLTDHEMPQLVAAAAEAGAKSASYIVLRLPHAVLPIMEEWLETHFPLKKDKVLNRLRELRGGKLYDSDYAQRMRGRGVHAQHLRSMFTVATRKAGLDRPHASLNASAFRVPESAGDQMHLC